MAEVPPGVAKQRRKFFRFFSKATKTSQRKQIYNAWLYIH